jgi:hypothetical protein
MIGLIFKKFQKGLSKKTLVQETSSPGLNFVAKWSKKDRSFGNASFGLMKQTGDRERTYFIMPIYQLKRSICQLMVKFTRGIRGYVLGILLKTGFGTIGGSRG